MRRLIFAAIAASAVVVTGASASAQPNCRPQAVRDLQRLAPDAHAIYAAVADKKFFMQWITCDDIQMGLATAVHETVHLLTEERDAFPLVAGGSIKRPHAVSRFYPPREIARQFNRNSTYVQTYLMPNAATSADDFLFLLDEFNAYAHDLNSISKLQSLPKGPGVVSHRDGLTAMMAFMSSYVQNAKEKKPQTWEGLQQPEVKKVIGTLWNQAETTLKASCGIPGIGMDDRKYISHVCQASNTSALGELLGRPATCFSSCTSPDTAAAQGSTMVR